MIHFKHEPVEEVIIKNLVNESLENFLYECYTLRFKEALWVDGVIIRPRNFIFGAGEKEYDDLMNGTRCYEKVTFVKFPRYAESVKWKDGGSYDLNLLNYSNNSKFRELAKWIKTQPEWDEKPEECSSGDGE
jgi:hypothetical protein